MMYTIRSEKQSDIPMIKELNDKAFGQENESNLIAAIRKSPYFMKELSLVAESTSGTIIGHILFSLVHIQTKTENVPVLALAPMAVDPLFQNRGIGSSLVKTGLTRCSQTSYKGIIVLGHPTFYPRFGFKPAKTKNISAPFEVPDEVFMVYEITPNFLHDQSGTVIYPDSFKNV